MVARIKCLMVASQIGESRQKNYCPTSYLALIFFHFCVFLLFFQVFRDHNIDGSALPLLTEDHLTLRLGLKLGPALKLRSIIAKKLGPAHADICVHCSHCNSKMADREETHLNNGISNAQGSADLNHERSASRNSNLSEK